MFEPLKVYLICIFHLAAENERLKLYQKCSNEFTGKLIRNLNNLLSVGLRGKFFFYINHS